MKKKFLLLILTVLSFSFYSEEINIKNFFQKSYFNNFFKKLCNIFNNNDNEIKNENFLFQKGLYYFNHSLDFDLDQTKTDLSIKTFNQFIIENPNHPKIKEANNFLKILFKKIERKYYNIANTYFLMNKYKASLIYFKNFIINYPNSSLKEEVLYKICLNTYQLVNCNKEKKSSFIKEYNIYKKLYPQSCKIKKLNILYNILLKL